MIQIDKHSEGDYLAMFKNMQQGFCIIEVIFDGMGKAGDYRFVEVNNVFAEKTGLRDATGKTMRELQPAHEEYWFEIFGEVVRTGLPRHFEQRASHLAGGVWYDVFALPFGAAGGNCAAVFFHDITDRKKGESDLRENERQHRDQLQVQLDENASELQAILDSSLYVMQAFQAVRNERGEIVDFTWRFVNKRWRELYGDEMKGKSLLHENPGVVASGLFQKFVHVTETGIPGEFDHYYAYEQFDAWFHQTHVKLGDGFLLTAVDITESKKAEQELLRLKDEIAQQATDKYYSIFNSTGEGFCIYEIIYNDDIPIDLRWLEVNPAFEKHTGLKNTVGRLASDVIPGTEQLWLDIYHTVHRTGEPAHFEAWHEPTKRWYHTFVSRIGGVESRQVAVTFNNISGRKKHERLQQFLLTFSEALWQSTDPLALQYEAVKLLTEQLEVARAAFYEVQSDQQTFVLTCCYDTAPAALPEQLFLEEWPPDLVNDIRSGRTLAAGDTEEAPAPGPLASLNIRAWMMVPLVKNGKLVAALFVHSATTRTWTNDEAPIMEELARRTWAAVERLKTEAALRESEQQLKRLLKLREEFISVASHELKTPITSMKAYAEIVQERLEAAGNHEDRELVGRLNYQIDRLTTLVNMLLDTTRIAEGQLQLERERFPLTELVRERIDEIRLTSDHHIEYTNGDGPIVNADRERIGQVISNLLSNAIKYSPKGSKISVRLTDDDKQVTVSVQDEGCGISDTDQEKIFERFFRVTANNMDTFPGMGLGLYISAQIIERHGGRIWVASTPSGGSTFSFSLPQAVDDEP